MRHNENLICTICGRKGSGKTELTKKIAKHYTHVIAVDTVAQYGPEDGFHVAHGKVNCAKLLLEVHKRPMYRVALRSDKTDELLELIGALYEFEDTLVIVDETPWYCSPSDLPDELSRLVRYGRHRRISQLYVTQRPSEIHRSITAQSDIIVSFVQREPRDVKYLIDAGGGDQARRVSELPEYRLIAFGDGMDTDKVPIPILEQMHEFRPREPEQLDLFEERT